MDISDFKNSSANIGFDGRGNYLVTKRLDPLMENINNPNLKVTTFKELGFRNRYKRNLAGRNQHFVEIDEDILSNFEAPPMSKSTNISPEKNSTHLPQMQQSENLIRLGNRIPPQPSLSEMR